MLEKYFDRAIRLRQLRRGPFGPHIDGLATELQRAGFAAASARLILTNAGRFSTFARALGISDASQMDESLIGRYLKEEFATQGTSRRATAANATRHVLEQLRRSGAITPAKTDVQDDPFAVLLGRYDGHLRDVQGLQAATREAYGRGARKLLVWHAERHGEGTISKLSPADVLTFVTEFLEHGYGEKWRACECSKARGFLRYLGGTGIVASGLDRAVPRTPCWRLSTVPRHLRWEQIRALIDTVDTTHPSGLRDKAILLLLATLGLRNSEVRWLELGQVAWRAGEIRLPRTKSRKERVLPMPHELGTALADYILHGRPVLDVPQVFLRYRAPRGPLATSGAIVAIVAKHMCRAGIVSATRGAHLLRHSLATRMVNAGVPIKTIADVLGHSSIDTTAIYTKVDTTRLATAALPFPGRR